MPPFPQLETYLPLIQLARAEDLGAGVDDVTSRLSVDANVIGIGMLVQKQAGIVCGLPMVEQICRIYDERLLVQMLPGLEMRTIEGRFSDSNPTNLMRIRGPLRSLLAAERVVLNFVQHLSGVATLANRFVKQIEGTAAHIVDTRKTMPGYRALDKYAVLAGKAANHRVGLYDMVLVKDNHLAAHPIQNLKKAVTGIVQQSRAEDSSRQIEVEVDTLEQFREILHIEGIDFVLLDNMDCRTLVEAVALRDAAGKRGKLLLEASGGVNLDTVRAIAMTGVERISVGSITHSAPALDIGLDINCRLSP